MRVLLQNRTSFLSAVAGDSIQLIKTMEYLIKLGVEVEYNSSSNLNLAKYQIIHLFNLMPIAETYQQFRNAQNQHKKIVLSPIFWDPQEFLVKNLQSQNFGTWWKKTMPQREEVLAGVAQILPNSQLELESLKNNFKQLPPVKIIPNAADAMFALAKPDFFQRKYQQQDFLLSVGRICQRKNQLSLIKAVRKLKLPLVLIGPINNSEYYQECRRASVGQKILYLDTLNQRELASAYAAARVHALVSWYDTPGLVSLEAALAGCKIVSTNRGSAIEYFGDLADYCNPEDLESITKAIINAWSRIPNQRLKEKVQAQFTWENSALATYQAYQTVLKLG